MYRKNSPDPFQEFTYPTVLLAKRAIADYLGQPLAKLSAEQRAFIDALLTETLNKKVIIERVRQYFQRGAQGEQHANFGDGKLRLGQGVPQGRVLRDSAPKANV